MTDKRDGVFSNPQAFFDLDGSAVMLLSSDAALDVCRIAATKGKSISRIEGGIWDGSEFEARLDCIWDAPDEGPRDAVSVSELAQNFIAQSSRQHNAFIITLRKGS